LIQQYAKQVGVTAASHDILRAYYLIYQCTLQEGQRSDKYNEIDIREFEDRALQDIRSANPPARHALYMHAYLGQYDDAAGEFPLQFSVWQESAPGQFDAKASENRNFVGGQHSCVTDFGTSDRTTPLRPGAALRMASMCNERKDPQTGVCTANNWPNRYDPRNPPALRPVPNFELRSVGRTPWTGFKIGRADAGLLLSQLDVSRRLPADLIFDVVPSPTGVVTPGIIYYRPIGVLLWLNSVRGEFEVRDRKRLVGTVGFINRAAVPATNGYPTYSMIDEEALASASAGVARFPSKASSAPTADATPCPTGLPADADLSRCADQVTMGKNYLYWGRDGRPHPLPFNSQVHLPTTRAQPAPRIPADQPSTARPVVLDPVKP